MCRRVVGRQVELDRDTLPEAVGMFEDAISRNIAAQDRYRIHSHLRKVRTEPAFQTRSESLGKNRLQLLGAEDAAGHVPDCAFFRRQVADVFGKKIDLGARRFSVRPAASYFTFAGHGSVIALSRQSIQHRRVRILRENSVKRKMGGWRSVQRGPLPPLHLAMGTGFDRPRMARATGGPDT